MVEGRATGFASKTCIADADYVVDMSHFFSLVVFGLCGFSARFDGPELATLGSGWLAIWK